MKLRLDLMLAGLIVMCFFLALPAFLVAWLKDVPHGTFSLLLYTLIAAESSLTAIWLAMSGPGVPWRIASVAVAVGVLAHAPHPAMQLFVPLILFPVFVHALVLAMPMLLVLAAGGRLLHVPDCAATDPEDHEAAITSAGDEMHGTGRRRMQFSLMTLLSWTAAIAALAGMIGSVPEECLRAFYYLRWSRVWLALPWIALPTVMLWSVLGTRRVRLRATAGAAVLLPAILLAWSSLLVAATDLVCLVGALLVVRSAGYRLVRVQSGLGLAAAACRVDFQSVTMRRQDVGVVLACAALLQTRKRRASGEGRLQQVAGLQKGTCRQAASLSCAPRW